jgi:hypothetical protein
MEYVSVKLLVRVIASGAMCAKISRQNQSIVDATNMTSALQVLIDKARTVKMTEEQLRAQRISFVYGNTHIENERITREMVIEADEKVCREVTAEKELKA